MSGKTKTFWPPSPYITSLQRFPSDVAPPSGKLRCIHASSQNLATCIICFQETKSRVIYNSNHLIKQCNPTGLFPHKKSNHKKIIQVAISAFSTSREKNSPPETPVVQLTTETTRWWFLGEGLDPTHLGSTQNRDELLEQEMVLPLQSRLVGLGVASVCNPEGHHPARLKGFPKRGGNPTGFQTRYICFFPQKKMGVREPRGWWLRVVFFEWRK